MTAAGLRVVAMCCDGLPQRHFLARLESACRVVAVVLHSTPAARGALAARLRRIANPVRFARHIAARWLVGRWLDRTERETRQLFAIEGRLPLLPTRARLVRTGDVNAPEVVALVRDIRPDVVVVNGTNLLRAPLLDLAPGIPLGYVNLHTGLSPYTRGGNCNLWALLEGHPEWVGVTVHRIDAGIDSGELIATAQTPLFADDLYESIHDRNFRQGFDLMLAALGPLAAGKVTPVRQWEEGRLYLKRTGYRYEPWLHVRVNRMIRRGLITRYLERREEIDRGVRTVKLP